MILICPACSTRYLIDPSALGSDGRMVRCAKCGHSWMQRPALERPPPEDLEPIPEEIRPIPSGSNLPALQPKPKPKFNRLWWLILPLTVGGIALGGYAGRQAVVDAWPAAEGVYAALGIAVDSIGAGLELQNVRSERRDEDGGTVLLIEGQIINVSGRERRVPLLEAVSLGPDRMPVGNWSITASPDRLLPGEIATFQSILRDPPDNIVEIAITFQGG